MKIELNIDGMKFLAETDYTPGSTLSSKDSETMKSAIFAVLERELKAVAVEYLKNLGSNAS